MIKVYVAGAYSGPDVLTVFGNMRSGIKHSATLMKLGFAVFSPWLDWPLHMHKEFTLEECYNSSLEWLKVSDAVFVVPGWEKSYGTKKEVLVAETIGIPVFYDLAKIMFFRAEKR